jgi:peptidyl-prolyl cis-trans isomerase B (cyclophilin B)
MTRTAFAILLTLSPALIARAAPADLSRLSSERVVFHTVAGDMVFALYPDAAPQTVQQFLKLVRAGVYDTTAIARIKPGFIAQVASAADRSKPLTPAQASLIHRLPVEPSSLLHVRGMLSLARKEQDPDSGETSFCIMLGDAPQLDAKYTVFGHLETGEDVLRQLVAVPRNDRMRPTVRLEVTSAEVVASAQALSALHLAPARPVPGIPPAVRPSTALKAAAVHSVRDPQQRTRIFFVAAGLLLIALLSVGKVMFGKRLALRHLVSLDLVSLLVCAFLLLVLLVPEGHRSPWLAAVLVLGVVGVLKLLGRFETPQT